MQFAFDITVALSKVVLPHTNYNKVSYLLVFMKMSKDTSADCDDGDPHEKIRHYQDQLEQVEAALAINPEHADLNTIKTDLLEIINILQSRLTDNLATTVGAESDAKKERGAGGGIKTANECVVGEKDGTSTTTTALSANVRVGNLVQINLEDKETLINSSQPVAVAGSSNNSARHGIENYLKLRQNDKTMLNWLGKYAKTQDIRQLEKLPEKLQNFVSELLPPGTDAQGQGQPFSIAHMDFRDVPNKKLRNMLNRKKKKMRHLEINAERLAQGLPPIDFMKKRRTGNMNHYNA